MNGIVFSAARNRKDRHDATGAFIPGAHRFARKYSLTVTLIDETLGDHKKVAHDAFFKTIADADQLDVIAYFGHGSEHGLPSAGIHSSDILSLAQTINGSARPDCKIVLYACSVAHPRGFAEKLATHLNDGMKVFGHTVEGHTFQNPNVARYPYKDEDTQPFLIRPGSRLWKAWNKELHSPSELWMRYPFLTTADIERWLGPLPSSFPPVFGKGRCWYSRQVICYFLEETAEFSSQG